MTQAAENLFEHALSMETLAQSVDREVFGQDAELAGPLKLTASHDSAERLIIPKLQTFTEASVCSNGSFLPVVYISDSDARLCVHAL